MIYKRFVIGVVVRLILLVLALGSLVYIVFIPHWWVLSGILLVVTTVILIELLQYVSKTNKDLAKFIDAINYKDYSVSFSSYKLGNAFDELHHAFRKTLQLFKELKLEKEAHYQYMLQLVKHVNVGIMAIDEKGKLVLFNDQAAQLLSLPNLVYWNRYEEKVPHFYQAVNEQHNNAKRLIRLKNSDIEINLRVTRLKVESGEHLVVIFQNIKAEIEDKEIDAWNKLIKILTHEIMNSVTPISSLTETLIQLEQSRNHGDDDLLTGLNTINRRSKSLLQFVDDYRKLASIPAPVLKALPLNSFLSHIQELYGAQLKQKNIALRVHTPNQEINIRADEGLLNQVFANLFSNSIHALQHTYEPGIEITVKRDGSSTIIHFSDNGQGIPEGQLGEIFVPFYSSKTEGSGIGLSLCKQIMHLHRGSISVASSNGETTFSLKF